MKKLLLILLLAPLLSYGQEVGIKGGPSYTLSTGDLKDAYGKGKFSFNAGVFTREDKGAVNFLFEAFYNRVNLGKDFNIHSGNLAFLLESKGRIGIQFGPAVSFSLQDSHKQLGEFKESIRPVNIDATAGVIFKVSERVGLNARYNYSLFKSIEDSNFHPQSVQLSVNYMIKKF